MKDGTTKEFINQLREFLDDDETDDDWLVRHTSVEFFDNCKTIQITIDNMNCQEYQWFKDAATDSAKSDI